MGNLLMKPLHRRVPCMVRLASLPGLLLLLLSFTLMTFSAAELSEGPPAEAGAINVTSDAAAVAEKESLRPPSRPPVPIVVNGTDSLITYETEYEDGDAMDLPPLFIDDPDVMRAVNRTASACVFVDDENGVPVCEPEVAEASRRPCSGGTAYGFSITAAASMTPVRTAVVMAQVADFIESSSRETDPNPNLYYANQFNANGLFDWTPFFDGSYFATNANQRCANAVQALQPDSQPQAGTDILGGISDLELEFGQLTNVHPPIYSAIAYFIIDGPLDVNPDAVVDAIADLQSSTLSDLGVPVTTVAIGIGPQVIRNDLELLASRPELVFEAAFYNTFAPDLIIAAFSIDTDEDGVNDCDDGCPTDPDKTTPGDCVSPLAGNIACAGSFAFLVDGTGSLGQTEFSDAVSQITQWIDDTSEFAAGAANTNEYYAISYTTTVQDRTNTFNTNAFGGVAQLVADFTESPVLPPETADTAVALDDVFQQFVLQRDGLPSDARFAFVITDGNGESVADVATAADLLSGEEVIVIAFPPAGRFDQDVVNAIATGQDGTVRVVPVSNYAALGSLISAALEDLDSDGDGAIDCADSCPLDADKLTGGACGCGVTDPPAGGPCP